MPSRPAHRFVTADVFTSQPFGGNQLAVFPDARGIAEEHLLPIAREFNYSEVTFVYPPSDPGHTRRVRIFTPGGELPFAGHPTIGTAHVLVATGEVAPAGETTRLVLEEGVGPVPVVVSTERGEPVFAQLSAAKLPEVGSSPPDAETLARVLSIGPEDIVGSAYAPQTVSAGLPYLIVPLRSHDAVRLARIRAEPWEQSLKDTDGEAVMVFALAGDGGNGGDPAARSSGARAAAPRADVHARVFVPGLNVPEDPATGSACAALGGYLAARTPRDNATLRWTVAQGVEMGRPSELQLEVDKQGGTVTAVRVGGQTVLMSEGVMRA